MINNFNNKELEIRIKKVTSDEVILKYWEEIKDIKELEETEEKELLLKANQKDEKAINALMRPRLKCVIDISLDYLNQGLELADVIMEGNIGLNQAIENYADNKNMSLKEYEIQCIKKGIENAIEESHHYYAIPLMYEDWINKYHNTLKHLKETLKREPTDEEIAQDMSISIERVKSLKELY